MSFGKATLVLAEGSGQPLAHWSLPAVTRLNPGQAPALFAPDEAGSETLEIEDEIMVAAIETVRTSVARRKSNPRQVRWRVIGVVSAAALIVAAIWLPSSLRQEALKVVPLPKRTEIGATLLGHMQQRLGPACRDPLGSEALDRLHDRILGEFGQVVVLPLGPTTPLALPGGIVVLSREMIERAAEPAVVAGQLLAARAAQGETDPLAYLLDDAGPWATARLLTTGNLAADALAEHADRLLAEEGAVLGPDILGPAFAQAEVAITPFALDRDPTGATVADLVAADPYAEGDAPLLITDSEWVALQGICRGS